MSILLASASAARRAILTAAGVPHDAVSPGLDEDEARAALAAEGVTDPPAVAAALAELKALKVSLRFPEALVLGADQVLVDADGRLVTKAADMVALGEQLRALRGQPHTLHAAQVLARNGVVLWRHNDCARLTMRDFSEPFLERYLAIAGGEMLDSVGGYHVEGLGAQLLASVEGDQFTVRGLPLFALLAELRARRVLAT